jgi:hypothetical protein
MAIRRSLTRITQRLAIRVFNRISLDVHISDNFEGWPWRLWRPRRGPGPSGEAPVGAGVRRPRTPSSGGVTVALEEPEDNAPG